MSVPSEIAGRAVVGSRPVAGGDINDAYAVGLDDGTHVFVKTRAGAAPGEYATEAAGLAWLGDGGALVPEVVEAGDDFLALEWLERVDADPEELGRRLAQMHLSGAPRFGASPPGAVAARSEIGVGEDSVPLRIGPLVLPNEPAPDWPTFYGEKRLAPLAARVGLEAVTDAVVRRLDQLCGPPEPPSRLHGDLWSGNVYGPYLIDPAAYGGHREVDLAMLQLFGPPSPSLLAAYDEVAPRAEGHEDRVELHQLFPLLVHAVLFGGSYVERAERVARRYA